MPQNDFLAFANDPAANVTTQTDWEGAASGNGVVVVGNGAGLASSAIANKAWRQSSVIAAAFAQAIVNTINQDVLDQGGAESVTAITTQIEQAIKTLAGEAVPHQESLISQNVTAVAAEALEIDMLEGWNVALTLTGNVSALSFANWPASGTRGKVELDIFSTGAFNITWPSNVIWTGGVKPTFTSGAAEANTIVLTSGNGGVSFRGFYAGQRMS